MIRISFRAAAAALVLSLSLLAVSPAQAAPLGGAQWISKMPAHWMDAALSWLGNLLSRNTPAQRTTEKIQPIDPSDELPEQLLDTGSCIDPQGNPCVVDPEP